MAVVPKVIVSLIVVLATLQPVDLIMGYNYLVNNIVGGSPVLSGNVFYSSQVDTPPSWLNTTPKVETKVETKVLQNDDTDYHRSLTEEFNLSLHPGTQYEDGKIASPSSADHCESLVYKALKNLPEEQVEHLKNLTLFYADTGRRGLGGGSTVVLRCQNVTDEELVAVLIHEMGHITDTGVITGSSIGGKSAFMDGKNPVYNNDSSLIFYSISWLNQSEHKQSYSALDFVSGYAMTDPFEDFAESYAYYVLHGDEFRVLAENNKALAKKYAFLKEYVFHDTEYENGYTKDLRVTHRFYDVTVLPFELNKFFAI